MKKARNVSRGSSTTPRETKDQLREKVRQLTLLNRELQAEISYRLQTEEILLREKAYLEALENSAFAGIAVVDRSGRHTHVSNAFHGITGYAKAELLGKEMPYPYWHPRDLPGAARSMREILEGGQAPPDGFEFRFLSRDGRVLDVAVFPFPFFSHGGLRGHILTVFDITLRKQAETVLRESEESVRSLIHNLPVGLCILRKNRVIFTNPALRGILHADCPDMEADLSRWFERIHPNDAAVFRSLLREARASEAPSTERELRIHPEEEADPQWVRGRAIPIRHLGEDALLLILIDVTQAKEFEQVLAIQERLASLGQLTSGIAHEIRNPLSGMNLTIVSIQQVLEREEAGIEPETLHALRTGVMRIQSLAERIESTIQKVMRLAKPAAYPVRPIDMNLVIEESLRLSLPLLRQGKVTVTQNLAADLPPCHADLHLMEHVLCNLIVNAVRAMESQFEDRILEVESSGNHREVIVSISDSGPGVPPSLRNRIFDPFFTTQRGGHGIGLSISHRIVTEHGGTISVGKSRWGGAEFRITLPAVGASGAKFLKVAKS